LGDWGVETWPVAAAGSDSFIVRNVFFVHSSIGQNSETLTGGNIGKRRLWGIVQAKYFSTGAGVVISAASKVSVRGGGDDINLSLMMNRRRCETTKHPTEKRTPRNKMHSRLHEEWMLLLGANHIGLTL
jgi:hypothetical protein